MVLFEKLFAYILSIVIYLNKVHTFKKRRCVYCQNFLNATNVKWDKENSHEYEASFEWKGEKYSANFSDTGEWLETESICAFNQLPDKVQTAFNASHKGSTIKAVAKIETSKGVTKYEVEIKQGIKTVELFYTADGTEIKE